MYITTTTIPQHNTKKRMSTWYPLATGLIIDGKEVGYACANRTKETDYFGVEFDVRKSDVQKAIRRGLFPQAMSSFFSIYMLPKLLGEGGQAQGKVTNMINRLMVIALEDIGVANPTLVFRVIRDLYPMTIDTKAKMPRDPLVLARCIKDMCESPKSRLCSHWYHVYTLEANKELAKKHGFDIHASDSITDPNIFGMLRVDAAKIKSIKVKPDRDKFKRELIKSLLEDIMHKIEANADTKPYKSLFQIVMTASNKKDFFMAFPAFTRFILCVAVLVTEKNTARGEFVRGQLREALTEMSPFAKRVKPEPVDVSPYLTYEGIPPPTYPLPSIEVPKENCVTYKLESYTGVWLPPLLDSIDRLHTNRGKHKLRMEKKANPAKAEYLQMEAYRVFRTEGAFVANDSDLMNDKEAEAVYVEAVTMEDDEEEEE